MAGWCRLVKKIKKKLKWVTFRRYSTKQRFMHAVSQFCYMKFIHETGVVKRFKMKSLFFILLTQEFCQLQPHVSQCMERQKRSTNRLSYCKWDSWVKIENTGSFFACITKPIDINAEPLFLIRKCWFRRGTASLLSRVKKERSQLPWGSASTRARIGIWRVHHSRRTIIRVFTSGKPLPWGLKSFWQVTYKI